MGFIGGYPDGTFQPNNSVNRAEFAKMLMLAFSKEGGEGQNLKGFPDVYLDQWYTPYLSRAVELGSMKGYPDGTMKPRNTINKAEALKMALEMTGENFGSPEEGQQWFEVYRQYAVENLNLDFVTEEDMGKAMTRGECVELILEVVND